MKTLTVSLALGVVLLAGCGKTEEKPKPPAATNESSASGNPLAAPVDYLGAVAKAKKNSEKTLDTVYLNQAVQTFYASEGRFPKDLNELVTEKYLPKLPEAPYNMRIVYDATKGQVKVVPQ